MAAHGSLHYPPDSNPRGAGVDPVQCPLDVAGLITRLTVDAHVLLRHWVRGSSAAEEQAGDHAAGSGGPESRPIQAQICTRSSMS